VSWESDWDSVSNEPAVAFGSLLLILTAAAQTSWGKSCNYPPKAHIELDQDEVANGARVRRAGSRLKHEPAILRMEHWRNDPEDTRLNPRERK
jgi:hypothetical protein